MPYKHDILVSVKWDPVFAEWVREYFLPLLKTYLKQAVIVECGRQFEGLFYYKEDIEPGEKWKSKLRHAIKESRCALALCSPEYFYSDYCLLEWHSFSLRGRLMGKNLIIPAAIHDGQAFPDYAKDIQEAGFQDYVIIGPGFRKTTRYVDFQDDLKKFSTNIAKRIKAAPEFADWPLAEEKHLKPADDEPDISQEHL